MHRSSGCSVIICSSFDMGRLADIIRASILEKYISSYMKERSADGVIVLKAGEGWIVSGEIFFIYILFFI